MEVNLPFIDRIWRVRSSLALQASVSSDEAFEKLDPLFQTQGTDYKVDGDTLTFRKHNPAAQDKLATFTSGRLSIVREESGSRLAYDLSSPALLMCFLAPFLFLAFAQLAVFLSSLDPPATEPAREVAKEPEKAEKEYELHWLDQALGAPSPKKPDEKDKDEKKEKPKHSATPGYVLAGLFVAVFIVGRMLEPWLIKRRFLRALSKDPDDQE